MATIDIMRGGAPLLQGRNIPLKQARTRLYFAAYGHNHEWTAKHGERVGHRNSVLQERHTSRALG